MKRILLTILLLLLVLPVFAEGQEKEGHAYFTYSSGYMFSDYEYVKDCGRIEFRYGLKSGFPNIFLLSAIDSLAYMDGSELFSDLFLSIVLAFAPEAHVSYDLLPSERHDLDVGVGIVTFYSPIMFPDHIYGGWGEVSLRYTYNFKEGNGIQLGLKVPLVVFGGSYLKGDADLEVETIVSEPSMALNIAALLGATVGYRISL